MTQTRDHVRILREQMTRIEDALLSVREDVHPSSPARFQMMAEAYVDQLSELRAQYEELLGVRAIEEAGADFVVGIEGNGISLGNARLSTITQVLDRVRVGIQRVLHSRESEPVASSGRKPKWVELLSDMAIQRLAPGSVRVHLMERPDATLYDDEQRRQLRETIQLIVQTAEWSTKAVETAPASGSDWKVLLSVLQSIAPAKRGPIASISLGGRLAGTRNEVVIGRAARERIEAELKSLAEAEEQAEAFGVVREIDLDKRTFSLRQRGGEPDIACEYIEDLEASVKAALDQPVIVAGTLRRKQPTQLQMTVEVIQVVLDESEDDGGQAGDSVNG